MHTIRSIYRLFWTLLFPPTDTARLVEQASPEVLGRLMSPTTLREHTIGLLPYRHPLIRALIIETKFRKNQKAISLLSDVLKDFLLSFGEDQSSFTKNSYLLVPIPLGAVRQKERGYNQVEEVIKKASGVFDSDLLSRSRDTKPQTSLARKERLGNVVGVFEIKKDVSPRTTYIVVDDVTTTGATLWEACEVLRKAGAQEVYGIALAH